MTEGDVGTLLRAAMMVMLKLGGPLLLGMLLTGLVISLVQAVTQINEATLVFLPKLMAVCVTIALLGPFMVATLTDFTTTIMDRLVAIGGS